MTSDNIVYNTTQITKALTLPLAKVFMSKEDALLQLNTEDEDLKKHVEKLLKSGKTRRPETFEKILRGVVQVLITTTKQDSLFSYYLDGICQAAGSLKHPRSGTALNSHESAFAELEYDENDKKGKKVFYVYGSRHS